MTDNDDTPTLDEALEELDDLSGQSYYTANDAFNLIYPFTDHATVEFVLEHDPHTEPENESDLADPRTVLSDGSAGMAASHRLDDVQRAGHEARGIVSVWPHQQILTVAEITDIICEMLGVEKGEGMGVGGGYREDSRHEENVENIREHIAGQRAEA